MELSEEWKFLGKVNFWTMISACAAGVIMAPDFATVPWYVNIARFITAAGSAFTIAQKVDRNWGDKKVEAAKIAEGFTAAKAKEV